MGTSCFFLVLPIQPATVAASVTGSRCPTAVMYVSVFGAFSALKPLFSVSVRGRGGPDCRAVDRCVRSFPVNFPTYAAWGIETLLLPAAMSAAGGATRPDSQALRGEVP